MSRQDHSESSGRLRVTEEDRFSLTEEDRFSLADGNVAGAESRPSRKLK